MGASKLMRASMAVMEETFDAEYVSLHVRYTNRAAFTLYSSTLGFTINDIEKGYYADKEDAYDMRKYFPKGLKKVEAEKAKKGKGGKDKKEDETKKDDTKKEDEKKDDDKKDEEETAAEAKDADGDEGK